MTGQQPGLSDGEEGPTGWSLKHPSLIHLFLLSGVRPDLVSRLLLYKTPEEVPQYMEGSIMFPLDDFYSGFVVIAIGGPPEDQARPAQNTEEPWIPARGCVVKDRTKEFCPFLLPFVCFGPICRACKSVLIELPVKTDTYPSLWA